MLTGLALNTCPVCQSDGAVLVESIDKYEVVRCPSCRLEYTRNPDTSHERYGIAYKEESSLAGPALRLSWRRQAYFVPPAVLTAAERWVLARVRKEVPKGSLILDVGCGSGRFLEALSRSGYRGVGIEPAASVVRTLRELGFDADVGHVPGLEWDRERPAAVVMFEVLEHLPEPMGALRELRKRFPDALLGLSVPSPYRLGVEIGERGASDYPPNHYLRFTPTALRLALEGAGFSDIHVVAPKPRGAEFVPGLSRVAQRGRTTAVAANSALALAEPSRLVATAGLLTASAYHRVADVLGALSAVRAARSGHSGPSLGAWARNRS